MVSGREHGCQQEQPQLLVLVLSEYVLGMTYVQPDVYNLLWHTACAYPQCHTRPQNCGRQRGPFCA
jgi:hypothetical protein